MYVCQQLAKIKNIYGYYDCAVWVEYTPQNSVNDFLSWYNNLSFAEVSALWTAVLMLFATAYTFKHLPFFIRRR